MSYDYEIEYNQGKVNHAVGALSRLYAVDVICLVVNSISKGLYQEIQDTWHLDVSILEISTQLKKGIAVNHYTWVEEQLRRKGKIMVGNNSAL